MMIWMEDHPKLTVASVLGLIVLAIVIIVKIGQAQRAASPPEVVADKVVTNESHAFSCGQNCTTSSNTRVYLLLAENGRSCRVHAAFWIQTRRGDMVKCPALGGWRME